MCGMAFPACTDQALAHSFSGKQKLPRVDVGSLEEVIAKMEADKMGDIWGDVMFIPPGALSSSTGK